MANETGQSYGIPQLNRQTGSVADIPQVQYATQAPGNISAFSEDAHALANSLSDINSKLNDRMDKIAADQGEAQGAIQASAGDVALKQDGTIRGQAFDAAAIRTMVATHDVEARAAADRIYLTNKDNPGALKSQLDAYANGVLTSNMPDVVKAQFKTNFGSISNVYMQDAARRAEDAQKDTDRAAYLQSLDARQKTIENLSMRAENDPAAAAALGQQLDDLKTFALRYGPKSAFTLNGVNYPADNTRAGITGADDIQKLVMGSADHARETRVLGKFMQLPTLQDKQKYALAFQQEFGQGKGQFTLEQSDKVLSQMHQFIERQTAMTRGQVEAVKSAFNTVQDQMEKGFSPGADAINSIMTQAQATGDPAAMAIGKQAQGLYQFQNAARQSTPAQLQDWLNTARGQANDAAAAGKSADPLTVAQVEMGDKLLTNMKTELARDPLSWAARVGLLTVAPLDNSPMSAPARAQAAHTVAAHYNTPLQLLTAEEAQQWKDQWAQGAPDARTAMVQQIQQNFGTDAVYAYGDIAKASPGIANAGALLASNPAHLQTVRDYAVGDAMLAGNDKAFPDAKKLLGGNKSSDAESSVLGDAYGFAPGAQTAVLDTAHRLYVARAVRQGLTPDSFDESLYNKALQESAGAWWDRGGQQYGGIVEQKHGHSIVLPPNTTEDQFNSLLKNLTDADLARASVGGHAPVYQNRKTMTADDFRDAYLISSGPGRYIVSTVNPKKTGQPVFLQGSNPQGLYEFDTSKLKGGRP